MTIDYAAVNQQAVELGRRTLADGELGKMPPGPMLFASISGGHLYGFPSPDSDLDIRGCHVLPLRSVIGLREPKETFEVMGQWVDGVEIDLVSHDLRKYLKLLLKNGGYIMEQIFSPLVVMESEHLPELRELARGAMTRNVLHHYNGFLRRQREIVSGEEPLLAKSVLYMFRVVMSGIHVLETAEVETDIKVLNELYPLPYLPDLWTAKAESCEKVELPADQREQFLEDAERLETRMYESSKRSPLPEQLQNHDALDDFLLRLRREGADE